MDEDLQGLDRDALIEEVKRLRAGIRAHRDGSEHELCWHHPELWGLLPEKSDPRPQVPDWPQFLRGCIRYRQSLDAQLPDAPRTDREFPKRPLQNPREPRRGEERAAQGARRRRASKRAVDDE